MSIPTPQHEEIAPRYLRVAAMVAKGLTYQEIAARLDLSVHTVHYYVHQLATELDGPELRELSAKSKVMVWWLRVRDARSPTSEEDASDRRPPYRTTGPVATHGGQGRSRSRTAR